MKRLNHWVNQHPATCFLALILWTIGWMVYGVGSLTLWALYLAVIPAVIAFVLGVGLLISIMVDEWR